MTLREAVKQRMRQLGYEVHRTRPHSRADFDQETLSLIDRVQPYTQTSPERIAALVAATEYVVRRDIEGDLVECGVWRGGSAMVMALTLLKLGRTDRRIWLYDTFAGMTEPGPEDADLTGKQMRGSNQSPGTEVVKGISAADVRSAVESTGYPAALLMMIEGPVEQTLPAHMPDKVALLRLDTDWYASTRHELSHLYPLLQPSGALIVDDYGHFRGARQAVDEYFAGRPLLLARIDYTGRIAVNA